MPNTSRQLDNIIKQLSKVVGGVSSVGNISIPSKVDIANDKANQLKYYVAYNLLNGGGSLGTMYNNSSLSSSSDFTPVGNMVATVVPAGLQLSASNSGVYTNRLDLTLPHTDLPQWQITASFKVSIGTGSYGVGVGLSSINVNDKYEIVGRIDTQTSAGTPIYLDSGTNGTFSNRVNTGNITLNNNDIVQISLNRNGTVFSLVVVNRTTGGSLSVNFTFTPSTAILPNISRFSVYLFGGTHILTSLLVRSYLGKGKPSLIIGDSKVVGYFASTFYTNIDGMLYALGYDTAALAGGFETTADVLNRLAEIESLSPTKVVLAIGCNDIRTSIPSGTWQANYSNIVSQLTSSGIEVVHLLPPKETAIDLAPLYTYINNTYSSNKIDAYTLFNTSTMLNGDGIHPNQTGFNFIVQQIVNSGLISP